jgi:hypothetical protein
LNHRLLQRVSRQRSGVTLGKRLEPLGLLRGKLALFNEPGDVENDPYGCYLLT